MRASCGGLRDRADELLLRYVEGEAPIEWMTNFIAQVDRMLTEQAKEKLAAQGLREPELPWAWVALHSEGRKKRLLRSSQRTGIVYADPPRGMAGDGGGTDGAVVQRVYQRDGGHVIGVPVSVGPVGADGE